MDPANLVQILESKDQSPDYQIKIAKIYMTFDRAECVRVVKKIVGASYAKEPKTCQVPIELVTVKEILEFLKKELKDDTLIKTWLDKANTLFSMSF